LYYFTVYILFGDRVKWIPSRQGMEYSQDLHELKKITGMFFYFGLAVNWCV